MTVKQFLALKHNDLVKMGFGRNVELGRVIRPASKDNPKTVIIYWSFFRSVMMTTRQAKTIENWT